jgi:hypothetical protein
MRRTLCVAVRKTGVQVAKLLTGLQRRGFHRIGEPTVFGQPWERRQESSSRPSPRIRRYRPK